MEAGVGGVAAGEAAVAAAGWIVGESGIERAWIMSAGGVPDGHETCSEVSDIECGNGYRFGGTEWKSANVLHLRCKPSRCLV